MSAHTERPAQLETPESPIAVEAPEGWTYVASAEDAPFTHLHFDREARAWRGHASDAAARPHRAA